MSESVAVVDSTSGGKIRCTVRKSAVGTPISGGLFTVTAGQDSMLCQAGAVETTNQAHEDESLRPMIAHMGEVPYYSGKADNERVTLSIVANYRHDSECIGPNRANPPSGSPVVQVNGLELWERERTYKAVVGQATSGTANVSLANRSFGNLPKDGDNGARGEAIHEAFFGQNGSAKTITALQRLALRLSQHPSMGAVLLDIKGDLQGHKFEGLGGHTFDFHGLLRAAGREVTVIPLDSVSIDGVGYFRAKMQSWLKARLSLHGEKAETVSRRVCDSLVPDGDSAVTFNDGFAARVVQALIDIVPQCYAKGGDDRVQSVRIDPERYVEIIKRDFCRMVHGDGKKSVTEVVRQAFQGGQIIALDIKAGEDTPAILTEVVERIRATAKHHWKQQSRLANMAVYIDEAHRWIAEGDDSQLASSIKTGLRETRAYGVAWCIVSQSMAALSKDVLKECRTKYFGRSLGIGADRRHLEDCLGRDALQQYEMLSSTGRYFFMAVGDDVNIGAGNGVVDFFTLEGDTTAKLIELNPHIFGGAK